MMVKERKQKENLYFQNLKRLIILHTYLTSKQTQSYKNLTLIYFSAMFRLKSRRSC